MTAGIKWGGVLQVQFTVPVTPQVFHKVFYKCQNYKVAPASSQEAGELVNDNETVTLNRDDIVKVFGVVSLLPVQTNLTARMYTKLRQYLRTCHARTVCKMRICNQMQASG